MATLAREVMGEWVNEFRLKPYNSQMPTNPFNILDQGGECPNVGTRDIGNGLDGTSKKLGPDQTD